MSAMSIDKARRSITVAWITAVISGTWGLAAILGVFGGGVFGVFDVWSLASVALTYALAFGIYRKSRTCAVLMLVAFVYGQLRMRLLFDIEERILTTLGPLIIVYLLAQGVRGTFVYHRVNTRR